MSRGVCVEPSSERIRANPAIGSLEYLADSFHRVCCCPFRVAYHWSVSISDTGPIRAVESWTLTLSVEDYLVMR